MSQLQKVTFFCLAVITMACFAVGSVMLAEERGGVAALLFVAAILLTGIGFITRKRILRHSTQRL
ncbi:MAG: DUF5325 family protein [Alicyclobacillus herbarius]|uniref:DUF5325 family protein n=1 Tax=Alicyclobacillus herbarius TaxID=122960 RepID=UPI0004263313|nr:DUF5325 family protein [Alicyclobacillus herbarius]MCL6631354.1 DUF5325 family protein [Alicyclobacillus herbarius]